ncbi:3-hydroxyacyl-CoA dehydrogenase [Bacillus sp. 165]|uniref:3-hydroxyacyl-CoA dehydrogenase n=1 Tax=Bacillus sp. 165 TaxID=1529117 RepID=UPI001ADC60D3|nr:3-hydroxyacyl-CoA dehydrogenase [Bacillus sp. 165]MBO9128415.1 3-hydroxyacyl-CoA dehydrogenase [Bacillus sp. 165]
MDFKNITVAGGGVLGSQIAFQVAFAGFNVSVYDISDAALKMTENRFKSYMEIYKEEVGATQEQVDAAFNRLSYHTSLAEAVKNADLVVEAVPEAVEIKEKFYTELAKVAPAHTIFATNSSTLPPSMFAHFTGRPEKFTTLHFCTEVWKHNIAEVMKHPGTNHDVWLQVLDFAKAMGMVPIAIEKEQPGYVLNTLLVPLLLQGLRLYENEVATFESIDKTWMISTRAPFGPFAFMDMIGLNTIFTVTSMLGQQGDEQLARVAEKIKTEFLDTGKLGKQAGEGFYTYPKPSFQESSFLK